MGIDKAEGSKVEDGIEKTGKTFHLDPLFNFIVDVPVFHPFHCQKIDKGTPHSIPGGIF